MNSQKCSRPSTRKPYENKVKHTNENWELKTLRIWAEWEYEEIMSEKTKEKWKNDHRYTLYNKDIRMPYLKCLNILYIYIYIYIYIYPTFKCSM